MISSRLLPSHADQTSIINSRINELSTSMKSGNLDNIKGSLAHLLDPSFTLEQISNFFFERSSELVRSINIGLATKCLELNDKIQSDKGFLHSLSELGALLSYYVETPVINLIIKNVAKTNAELDQTSKIVSFMKVAIKERIDFLKPTVVSSYVSTFYKLLSDFSRRSNHPKVFLNSSKQSLDEFLSDKNGATINEIETLFNIIKDKNGLENCKREAIIVLYRELAKMVKS